MNNPILDVEIQMKNDDDDFFVPDQETDVVLESNTMPPWHILVIDDEKDIHSVTTLALRNVTIHCRPLKLSHAYSGIEAIAYLKQTLAGGSAENEVHLLLLDMVMESDHAGFDVARWLRDQANRCGIPVIILRTGQAGYLNTDVLLNNQHIDTVIEKERMTSKILVDTLTLWLPGTGAN